MFSSIYIIVIRKLCILNPFFKVARNSRRFQRLIMPKCIIPYLNNTLWNGNTRNRTNLKRCVTNTLQTVGKRQRSQILAVTKRKTLDDSDTRGYRYRSYRRILKRILSNDLNTTGDVNRNFFPFIINITEKDIVQYNKSVRICHLGAIIKYVRIKTTCCCRQINRLQYRTP